MRKIYIRELKLSRDLIFIFIIIKSQKNEKSEDSSMIIRKIKTNTNLNTQYILLKYNSLYEFLNYKTSYFMAFSIEISSKNKCIKRIMWHSLFR